ncbi:MAG: hypothetical protein LBI61_01880 [Puniceicoccales bacterium]|jgi:hypothetical protein|nr:hypothetical protein [Puniceicoccales bacterium]
MSGTRIGSESLAGGIAGTAVGQIDANVVTPGPTGVVGDLKTNPLANPNIPRDDVSSTQYVSIEITENTNPGTVAFYNQQQGMKQAADYTDPDLDSNIQKVVAKHGK